MSDDLSGFQTVLSGLTPLGLEAAAHSPITFALSETEQDIAALLAAQSADPALAAAISALVAERIAGLQDIAARLATVEDLGLRLIGERDAEQMIALFLAAATRIMQADHLAVCLLDAKSHTTCHLVAHGFDPAFLAPHSVARERLPGSLLNAANAMLMHSADAAGIKGLPENHPAAATFLGLPVLEHNRLHGWLYFTRAPGAAPFDSEDERFAATLAAQLAVAYENLTLYQSVQRHAAQLQLEAAARQQSDLALRASEHRLRLAARIFESTQESIMMTDANADIIAVNGAFELSTGYSEQEVMGRNPRLLKSGRHDSVFYRGIWTSLQSHGQWRGEIWNKRKNGEVYPERIAIDTVRGDDGEISAYVSVSSDVSALKEAHHQVDFLSNHNALTLLPNRSVLIERLRTAINAARDGERQIALLLFNLDRLQRINDSLGHETGDSMLREIARRAGTLAGPYDVLAHLGGDEFVLLLTQCLDSDDVVAQAGALIEAVAGPFDVGGHDLIVTASVGISIYPRDGTNPSELLKAADVALSHMKDTGRNGFRFFKGEMNAQALRWMSLETHLRRAIERGELSLNYQPQVSIADGQICSMEALLRWRSPELGQVAPNDFIALAEDTGMILPIGNWVIRQACIQNKAWQDAGLTRLRVAVNVSAHQFMVGTVPQVVREALRESGLEARYLEVELTESVMMHDTEATAAQLTELTEMGVSISLDDFGTGYSSLGYLSRFMLDKLKIDQTFVRNITTEPRSAAIAQATIALAHGLSLVVIAEGVETEGQLAFLKAIGCDEVQGYLFSRAVPADDMARLMSGETPLLRLPPALELPG